MQDKNWGFVTVNPNCLECVTWAQTAKLDGFSGGVSVVFTVCEDWMGDVEGGCCGDGTLCVFIVLTIFCFSFFWLWMQTGEGPGWLEMESLMYLRTSLSTHFTRMECAPRASSPLDSAGFQRRLLAYLKQVATHLSDSDVLKIYVTPTASQVQVISQIFTRYLNTYKGFFFFNTFSYKTLSCLFLLQLFAASCPVLYLHRFAFIDDRIIHNCTYCTILSVQ